MIDATKARERDLAFWVAAAIAASTVVAGLTQMVAPGFVLDLVDAERDPTTRHLFAIVGMFMAVVGGMVGHALLRRPDPDRDGLVLLWAAIQKGGAFAAISLGMARDVFGGVALLVAINDLASAGYFSWYRRSLAGR